MNYGTQRNLAYIILISSCLFTDISDIHTKIIWQALLKFHDKLKFDASYSHQLCDVCRSWVALSQGSLHPFWDGHYVTVLSNHSEWSGRKSGQAVLKKKKQSVWSTFSCWVLIGSYCMALWEISIADATCLYGSRRFSCHGKDSVVGWIQNSLIRTDYQGFILLGLLFTCK